MRCVHSAMTSSLLPVGVANESLADAAIARCFDAIEAAASALAGNRGAIDVMRASLRAQLYDYALQVAGTSHTPPAYVSDTTRDESPEASRSW